MSSLKILSNIVGKISEISLPNFIKPFLFKTYCNLYNVNTSELPRKFVEFHSFQDFFSREIIKELRPIANSNYVSPVDGLLVDFGYFTEDKVINIKSLAYLLDELIPEKYISNKYKEGLYLILYLSPSDYHRIHSPTDGMYMDSFRISGDLRTVNPKQGQKLPKILVSNERLICNLKTQNNSEIALVAVGATNVGSISLCIKDTQTTLSKGQEFAKFNLGSTVVLCFAKNSVSSNNLVKGKHYKMGEKLELE